MIMNYLVLTRYINFLNHENSVTPHHSFSIYVLCGQDNSSLTAENTPKYSRSFLRKLLVREKLLLVKLFHFCLAFLFRRCVSQMTAPNWIGNFPSTNMSLLLLKEKQDDFKLKSNVSIRSHRVLHKQLSGIPGNVPLLKGWHSVSSPVWELS